MSHTTRWLEEKQTPEQVYGLFTGLEAALIEGKTFLAVNYGLDYMGAESPKHLKLGISGKPNSYYTSVLKSQIPDEVVFKKEGPYMPLVNVSHISGELTSCKTDMRLCDLIKMLKSKGMRFK